MTEATPKSAPSPSSVAGPVPRLAAALLAVLALAALAGWWLDSATLRSGITGYVSMNPVTAVALLLAALALKLSLPVPPSPRARRVAHACAAAVVLLALLSASRHLTPWDLGLDRFLFADQLARADARQPNRMAPNSALNFVLIGAALLCLDLRTRRGWRPAEGLALATGILGLVALAGYVWGSAVLYGVGTFIPMAANTALGFLVLAAGVLWARPREGLAGLFTGHSAGSVLARQLLPAALLVPLVLGWLRLQGQALGLYETAGGVALMVAATTLILATLVWRCAVALDRSDLARSRAELELRKLNGGLESRVAERTAALERVNDQLQALLDASPLAICSLSRDGTVWSWNHAAEALFGWTADEVVGRPLPTVPPELGEEHRRLRERVLGGHPFTNFETRRRRKDGGDVEVSISTAPLRDTGGVPCGVVAVYLDIGGRKELEARLLQSQKMEAVGRLAGGVAHDFNNLLVVMRTAAEFQLADLEPGHPSRQEAAEIRDTADRAARLTRQLLAFSRRQMLEPRVLDLNLVLADLEPMIRRVVEENIAVETRLRGGLERVQADRGQLEQVVLNLVVNARDAMPDGGRLLIETSNVPPDRPHAGCQLGATAGAHVCLTVTDTGCGMDEATRARVFEPFFTTKEVGEGTGLGLATVYGIVQQSGGHIAVHSDPGQGATFEICFPRYSGPEPGRPFDRGPVDREGSLPGAGILIVEDDHAVRHSLRRVLERHGYEVTETADGHEALAAAAGRLSEIDLVISDIVMPEMSGLELRERLQALRPGLPVLLMSGHSEEAIHRLASQGSIGPVVQKPFTARHLLEMIRKSLVPASNGIARGT